MTSRRLVITVCPREPGVVALPVERGARARRFDAVGLAAQLDALVATRGLGDLVSVRRACAGGCSLRGPNVSVALYPAPHPGEKVDQVAIGWRTYVGVLEAVDCVAAILDDNVSDGGVRAPRRPAARSRRR
jgi:hypothetical protein